MSNILWPYGLQYARLPCPSPSPAVYSDSCPLSQWCYLTISSSTTLFSFCLQSVLASRDFSIESALCIRWPRYWSFCISPSNEYSVLISFRIDWFDLFAVQGLSRVFSNNSKPSILSHLILWSPVSCGLY